MKNIPPSGLIEAALETIVTEPSNAAALNELRSAGLMRLRVLKKIAGAKNATERGYLLGLSVASAMIATRPDCINAGIEL
jgi:hypothetical protein